MAQKSTVQEICSKTLVCSYSGIRSIKSTLGSTADKWRQSDLFPYLFISAYLHWLKFMYYGNIYIYQPCNMYTQYTYVACILLQITRYNWMLLYSVDQVPGMCFLRRKKTSSQYMNNYTWDLNPRHVRQTYIHSSAGCRPWDKGGGGAWSSRPLDKGWGVSKKILFGPSGFSLV